MYRFKTEACTIICFMAVAIFFIAVMVHIQFSEFWGNTTLMASMSKLIPSMAVSWPGLPRRQTVHADQPHRDSTAQRWTGDERGVLIWQESLWSPGPWDLLSTSNHGDQGPAMGHAHRGFSLWLWVKRVFTWLVIFKNRVSHLWAFILPPWQETWGWWSDGISRLFCRYINKHRISPSSA